MVTVECYLTTVSFVVYTDVSYTANEAYAIADRGETFPCGGDGTFDDKERMKVIYEVVSDVY